MTLGHADWHHWWSGDARVQVQWEQNAGGSRWRYPRKNSKGRPTPASPEEPQK